MHLALIAYCGVLIFKAKPKLARQECEGFEYDEWHYVDITAMAIAHGVCAVLLIVRKTQSKRTDVGSAIKTICKIL